MKKYSTYLFDFDYTLANSSQGIVICFRHVLEQHGFINPDNEAIKRTIGKTLEEAFNILTGITDSQTLATFRKEYVKEADIHMTSNTTLYPETLDVLNTLKLRHTKIGIISTKYRYRILELMNRHVPENFFNIIVGGEDVKTHKPSPEGLLHAIDQLSSSKEETLYIGDSTVDAQTAQAASVDFWGVLHGVTTREELAKYPNIGISPDLYALTL